MARNELKSNLAKGAIGLAVTAGAIAAGMVLADKDNRTRLRRSTRKTRKRLSRVASRVAESYPEYRDRFIATAHTIRRATRAKPLTKAHRTKRGGRGRAKK